MTDVSRSDCMALEGVNESISATMAFSVMKANSVYAIIITETWMLSNGDCSTGMRLSMLVLICARWLTRSVSPEMMSPKGMIDGVRRHSTQEVRSVANAMKSIVSCPLARGILPPIYHRMIYIMVVKMVEAYSAALACTDMRRCACGKYSDIASRMLPKVKLKMNSILL